MPSPTSGPFARRNGRGRAYDEQVMKRLVSATGLVVVALFVAGPVHADTDVDDFLSSLDSLGITDIAPGDAVALGQSLCPLLAARGQNTADIVAKVAETVGRPIGPASLFAGAAISNLCPRAIGELADGDSLISLLG